MKRAWFQPVREAVPFLAAAALWLAPLTLSPSSVAFWRGGAYSDLVISHWPNALLVHQGAFDAGRIPLWNPTILSGTPFAADPLSGIWYLPNWLAVLFPVALSFNLLFLVHLAWAGWGAARLAKAEGVEGRGALVSGLAFAGAPKLIGHIGLGHLGLVEAVCWTPWLLVAIQSMVDTLSRDGRGWLRKSALLGVIFGVIFLADPRWSVPAGIIGIVYAAFRLARSHNIGGSSLPMKRVAGGATASGLFALGTAAGLAIPLWEFLQLSTRAGLTAGERTALSLPLGRLTNLVVPDFGGWPEWLAYPGIAVIVLAALAFAGNRPKALFWWATALGGGLLALGPALPIYPIADLLIPGLSFLRVPARFLFLTSLSFAVLAGLGLQSLLHSSKDARSRRGVLRIGIIASTSIILIELANALAPGASNVLRARAFAGTAFTILAFVWLGLMTRGMVGSKVGVAGWVFLVCADLALMAFSSLRIVPADSVLEDRASLAETVAGEAAGGRVLSPSYSLHQPSAVIAGLELADGIVPLQLASYRDFMSESLGFSAEGYSVTLPPFPNGDPTTKWPVSLDPERLGLLNVTHVVSDFPLQADGLVLDTRQQGAYVYRNAHVRPRAWLQPSRDATQEWSPIERIELSVDAIQIRARGPETLVVSEVSYPGWRATIDGRMAPITTVYGLLMSVDVPEGAHDVVLEFRPAGVYVGGGVTLLTLLALAGLWSRR